ncbi:MAG: hypothetical protein GY941_13645 [Planctomycetes bacterium]|nr:hypothetical protein [Planctomycetota bacterium]
MTDYKKITTSPEVWAVIKARHHKDLGVFGSFSAPDGDHYGNPDEGIMKTEYGFKDADYPLMGAETRWDIDRETPHKRINERHEYWLCLPIDSGE